MCVWLWSGWRVRLLAISMITWVSSSTRSVHIIKSTMKVIQEFSFFIFLNNFYAIMKKIKSKWNFFIWFDMSQINIIYSLNLGRIKLALSWVYVYVIYYIIYIFFRMIRARKPTFSFTQTTSSFSERRPREENPRKQIIKIMLLMLTFFILGGARKSHFTSPGTYSFFFLGGGIQMNILKEPNSSPHALNCFRSLCMLTNRSTSVIWRACCRSAVLCLSTPEGSTSLASRA